jgi:isoquinoline 1-oxidoreductase beta subunit
VVADVEVDVAHGTVRVARLTCAHDCGRIVDADQVRAQCEGNLVWGLGMVLIEALPVADSTIGAATFADSSIPRFADVPPMRIELVDDGDPPGGAGETAIVAAGGAIANAVFDAIGYRAPRVPVRAIDVRAHVARAAAARTGACG